MHGSLGRILKLFKPYKKWMALAMSLEVVSIFTRLILPRLTATVVNDVITAGKYNILMPLCA